MAPKYKLVYFDLRGIIEPARYMFAYKGVPYEDFRIAEKDWPIYKPKQPFGYLPVLEIDSHSLAGSQAIMRYLAKEFGLAGKDNLQAAMADMAVDSFQETFDKMRNFAKKTEDEAKKEELKNIWTTVEAPNCLAGLEQMLKKNGGKYFAGDSLTWADFVIPPFVEIVEQFIPQVRKDYPVLIAHLEQINSIPAIKKWREKRPVTPL